MINLEVLRFELNYLKQVVKGILGDKVSIELGELITALVTCFLYPATYDSFSISHLQTIEQYLNQIQQTLDLDDYQLLMNNIPTIKTFLGKVKIEIPKY
jgi:hypothetical protein